jgi:hypothetical protein
MLCSLTGGTLPKNYDGNANMFYVELHQVSTYKLDQSEHRLRWAHARKPLAAGRNRQGAILYFDVGSVIFFGVRDA